MLGEWDLPEQSPMIGARCRHSPEKLEKQKRDAVPTNLLTVAATGYKTPQKLNITWLVDPLCEATKIQV